MKLLCGIQPSKNWDLTSGQWICHGKNGGSHFRNNINFGYVRPSSADLNFNPCPTCMLPKQNMDWHLLKSGFVYGPEVRGFQLYPVASRLFLGQTYPWLCQKTWWEVHAAMGWWSARLLMWSMLRKKMEPAAEMHIEDHRGVLWWFKLLKPIWTGL
jgi:hypothetical protein